MAERIPPAINLRHVEKVAMDFATSSPLGASRRWRMDDREAREKRAELVSQTFALITAKCEDAAALAAECQGGHSDQMLRENGEKLRDLICEAGTIIDSVMELLCRSEA